MNSSVQKYFLIGFLFILITLKLNAQSTIGSQIAFNKDESVKYYNGSAWITLASGLPGQDLIISNDIPTWTNNPNGIITNTVTNINLTTATCGGNIMSSSGSPITARGVCWSINHNPTIADNHTNDGNSKGIFTSNITGLTPKNTYYVRTYATNNAGTAYGNEVSFYISIPFTNVDYDGNVYDTIRIGTQTWMKQNLKVTHYNNGDAIPKVTDNTSWSNLSSGAYCEYGAVATFGRLYNWYTVVDPRNLCPLGWHVPSDAEFTVLTNYLGGLTVAGGKLKEAGTSHWQTPNTGATNSSGFTALSSGFRYSSGTFSGMQTYCIFWSSTEYSLAFQAWYLALGYSISSANRTYDGEHIGASVRCLRD